MNSETRSATVAPTGVHDDRQKAEPMTPIGFLFSASVLGAVGMLAVAILQKLL